MKHKKIIIFDFDGTIADSLHIVVKIINHLSEKYGYRKMTPGREEEFRGKSFQEAVRDAGLISFRLPFIIRAGKIELAKRMDQVQPFRGMPSTLKALHDNGFQLGIITSNSQPNVREFLDRHDMLNMFDFIYTSSMLGKKKLLNRAMKTYGLKPNQVIYVGDETRDIEAAKQAGVECIAVSWGYNSKPILEEYQPHYLLDTPHQLTDLLISVE